jgi:hypothetical protein
VGSGENGCLNHIDQDPASGLCCTGDVPAGTAVTVTSVNRLEASSLHPAAYVEAPTPEHIHEALDLGKDLDPGMATTLDLAKRPK